MEFQGFKARYPDVPILALSGSMNPEMIETYIDFMDIDTCYLVHKNPDRSNIYYKIVHPVGKMVDGVIEYIKRSISWL